MIMDDVHRKNEVRADLMFIADLCGPMEEKHIVVSMVGIDDVSGKPTDPSLVAKAWQEEMRGFEEREQWIVMLREESLKQIQRANSSVCAGLV